MSKLRVLLTGPGGRVGPHLLPDFAREYDLRLLDRNPVNGWPETILTDLQDTDVLQAAMEGVDVVVHLAATANESPFVENLLPNNIVGVYNVFEAAREAKVRRIVFASTVQTVGYYPRDYTIQADDPPRPVSVYGVTKVFGEALGRFYYDRHKIEFVGVRIGACQPPDSPWLREHEGLRTIWLSPRDASQLLRRAVETPDIGYAIVFGTSKTTHEFLSLQSARELLGYEPEDDIRTLFPEG